MTSPFGPLVVIANPRAGRGKVGAHLVEIERLLTDAGLSYRIVRTTHPGHATEAARDALDRGERYLGAAGGDGTVHEVLNGMIAGDRPVAGDAVEAARHLAGDAVRLIDVAKVTFRPNPGRAEVTRYFANIAEAGLGGAVVDRTLRLPGFLGGAKYFCGFWLTLPGFRPGTVRLDADGQEFAGRAFNVVVANCRFYGGGMQISPKSDPCDGALEVLVMIGPKSDAFTTLPKVYRGTHLPHRHITELRASRVRIEADPPLEIEADGEILGTTPATFEVIPGAIRVKV